MKSLVNNSNGSNYGSPMGWVKLYRQILDSPIIQNPILSQVYLWCLLKANHQLKFVSLKIGMGMTEVKCDKNQFITGRKVASRELSIAETTFYKNLKKLEKYGYISIESNNHYSLITVINNNDLDIPSLEQEQPIEHQMEQDKNKSRTTDEQPKNTNNNLKNYKNDNSLNNKNSYDDFLSNSSLQKFDKNFVKEYRDIIVLIQSELHQVLTLKSHLSPEEVKKLLAVYSIVQIKEKLKAINSWDKIKPYHNLFDLLKRFLERGNGKDDVKKIPQKETAKENWLDIDFINNYGKVDKRSLSHSIWDRFSIYDDSEKESYIRGYEKFNSLIEIRTSKLKKLTKLTLRGYIILTKNHKRFTEIRIKGYDSLEIFIKDLENWNGLNGCRSIKKAIDGYFEQT